MTDIEGRITGFLRDEADHAALPNEMYRRVLHRARIRRLVTATVAGVAMLGIVVAGVVTTGALRSTTTIAPAGPEKLPDPPDLLRDRLPDKLDRWIKPGLVLLYRDGGIYHAFFEGVMYHHGCLLAEHLPNLDKERNRETCFHTAQHFFWERATPEVSWTGDRDLNLPVLPEGAELLWQGVPEDGSIGIGSPGACARIERFDGHYKCRGDAPVYVWGDRGTPLDLINDLWYPSSGNDCPPLLRPGRHARRRATAAARRWAKSREADFSASGFTIEVEAATGSPQGGCYSRSISNRKQTWERTRVATIDWRFEPGSEAANSASLASSTVFLGRTVEGWKVYYHFH